jgi:hypothetical protein
MIEHRAADGWRLSAVEWSRPSDYDRGTGVYETPFGLRIAAGGTHLEESPDEVEVLLVLLEGIARDQRMGLITEDLNRRGWRMRGGGTWTQPAVFDLLPALIQFSPKLFQRQDWIERRKKLHEETVDR